MSEKFAAEVETPLAVSLRAVSKVYKLYSSRGQQVADSLGLPRFLLGRRSAQAAPEFRALNDITLDVPKGQRLGIVGRNGAGKTTLLKLITENFRPTSGQVQVNGGVQALMQMGLGFHPEFSGRQNIRSALNYNGLSGEALKRAVEDVEDFVELGEFLHQPMKTYSLGMQTRVQFATATAIQPDIVIIDEILGAGDAYFSAKCAVRMEKLAMSGCTLLLVSHSWQQIQQFCERVIWLKDGAIHMDGSATEVLAAYDVHVAQDIAGAKQPARSHQDEKASGAEELLDASRDDVEAFGSTGPDYANVDWIAERIRAKDQLKGIAELTDRLEDGHRVFRIPGVPGLRFSYVAVKSNGKRVTTVGVGSAVEIEFKVTADISADFVCSYWIHFFGIDGRRLCRLESKPDSFHLQKGAERLVRIDLTPFILGAGDYLMSFSLFDVSRSDSTANLGHARYEMLARSYQLKVAASNDSDPPVVHYPASWSFGDSKETRSSAIKSFV